MRTKPSSISSARDFPPLKERETMKTKPKVTLTPGQKAAMTRKRRAAGRKAATTRKRREAARKAAVTRAKNKR